MLACRLRLPAIALLLAAGGWSFAACGSDDPATPPDLTLTGSELRDFLGTLLLTREDIPGALDDSPPEEWRTDSPDGSGDLFDGLGLEGTDWLGTLSRPLIVRTPQDRTFTVGNTASAFATVSGAEGAFDVLMESDADEMGADLVATTSATSYEVHDLPVAAGDDAWSVAITAQAEVDGSQEDLTLAMVGFRRGPIVVVVHTLGFIDFGEALVGQLARAVDGRVLAGLDGL